MHVLQAKKAGEVTLEESEAIDGIFVNFSLLVSKYSSCSA